MMARCKLNPCCGATMPGECTPPPQIKPNEGWDAYEQRTAKPASEPAGGDVAAVAKIIDPEGFKLLAEGKNLTSGQAVTYRDAYGKAHLILAALSSSAGAAEPDMRRICEALGFDPTNHHNAAKCPYCSPAHPAPATVEMPDDLISHRTAWRSALVLARDSAPPAREDFDDRAYWQHELEVFDRVYAALAPATEGRKS